MAIQKKVGGKAAGGAEPQAEAKPKAYSYIRMSTPDQLKGDSLRRQLARSREYAERHGLELIESFNDLGVSGFRGRNAELGALAQFKNLVDQGEIEPGSYLIVESMDRLSRQKVMDAFLLLAEIVGKGITLITLDDQQVYSKQILGNETFKLFIALGAMSRAHEESRRKSDLLSQTWKGKRKLLRESGKILTSQVPAWLRADRATNTIAVIPDRVEIVREIFTMTRDGYGTYSIAHELNKRRVKPWSTRKNAVWRESYIKKILTSRTVLGEFQSHITNMDDNRKRTLVPEGEPIKDYYPAVVSHQLFQEAALATDIRRQTGKGRKGKTYANLFTGILQCKCTAGMRYIDKGPPPKGGQYLRCSVSYAGGNCKAPAFRYQIVETKILHAIETLDVGKVMGGDSRKQRLVDTQHKRSLLQVDLEGVEKKIRFAVEAITTGTKSRSLTDEIARLEKQEGQLKLQVQSADLEIEEMLTVNPKVRQEIIGDLLTKIRAKTDREHVEKTRRALASELLRLIEKITVEPASVRPDEVLGIGAKWKVADLMTEGQIESNLKSFAFVLKIRYRNGDVQEIEGWHDRSLKFKQSPRMKQLKTKVRASAA